MDTVTATEVAITLTVPLSRAQMWERITAVERIGEWSPEVTSAHWCDDGAAIAAGARFVGHNRFPHGLETTVMCEVTEAEQPERFASVVFDDDGLVGSAWRYDLRDGPWPGSTIVRQSFTHGPGASGARTDPPGFTDRLAVICRNMATTVTAMAGAA